LGGAGDGQVRPVPSAGPEAGQQLKTACCWRCLPPERAAACYQQGPPRGAPARVWRRHPWPACQRPQGCPWWRQAPRHQEAPTHTGCTRRAHLRPPVEHLHRPAGEVGLDRPRVVPAHASGSGSATLRRAWPLAWRPRCPCRRARHPPQADPPALHRAPSRGLGPGKQARHWRVAGRVWPGAAGRQAGASAAGASRVRRVPGSGAHS
jgi:hypothetical protein